MCRVVPYRAAVTTTMQHKLSQVYKNLEDTNWPFNIMKTPSLVCSVLCREVSTNYERFDITSIASRKTFLEPCSI